MKTNPTFADTWKSIEKIFNIKYLESSEKLLCASLEKHLQQDWTIIVY